MDKNDKIRIAITSGIGAVILLILVLYLAISGKVDNDDQKLEENIAQYASDQADTSTNEASAIISGEDKKDESDLSVTEDSGSSGSSVLTYSENTGDSETDASGNGFYVPDRAIFNNIYRKVEYDVYQQLKELSGYWSQGNTDAVRDLAHLERFEAMSYSLEGSNDFYYYGELDSDGVPDGIGVAVYANDQYYYGNWASGVRSGDGTWISFYPSYSSSAVTEHIYSGQWSEDRPDGKGQEHYDYNSERMNDTDTYLQNIIGMFSGGYYNGNMYVITVDKQGKTTEWDGVCNMGTWQEVSGATSDKNGRLPYLYNRLNADNHLYMTKDAAANNGIIGIMSGGSMRE